MKESRDASNRLSIELAESDSNILFKKFAKRLVSEFNAEIVEKLDGLDQRYWDFGVSGTIVVLHSDNYMGISVHVENGTNDNLLRQIATDLINNLKTTEPRHSPEA
ncbi:DUF3630 family protein [Thermodesulfobacteriota bacterium]